MTSNILEIPFRRTQSVNLSAAIKSYIESKFDQQSAAFEDDCRAIERLRNDAIHVVEPHTTGVQRLTVYAAQLRYMSSKFPLELGVDFAWWPAIGYHTDNPITKNNIRFELANILFNLAALYSQLAFTNNRTTEDGLKQAALYEVAAAGTLNFLRTDVIPDMRSTPPEDMDEATLLSLENICLAQAQECFWGKAVKGGMKDGTIARLAACVSDYYAAAGDFAVKSDAVSTEWIHHLNAKHHHFAAAAQYRQSIDCLEKRKYGEEVARLRDSVICVDEGLKEKRWINRVVEGDLNGLKSRVKEELRRAEKDNDVIYLLPVPPKSELKILDRANMVAPKPPKEVADGIAMLGKNSPLGQPLFEKLVPYAVHQAATVYAERRDRLVNESIIAELEAMTTILRELLASLNLPGSLQALEKPLGLPPSLMAKAEELRQQDASYKLKRSVEDTTRLKTNDMSIFQDGLGLLDAEKEEDEKCRSKYGTDRWSRPPSEQALAKWWKQSQDLQGYLNSAGASDNLVLAKMRENEHILRLLTGPDRDLERFVPSSKNLQLTPAGEKTSSKLRGVLNDVSRLESRRKRKIETIRTKAKSDDIGPALHAEAARLEREYPMQPVSAAQFEHLFEERLEIYEPDRESLTSEQEDQNQLTARLREANTAFIHARRGETEQVTKDREEALQKLELAYVKYKEIVQNLENGRKFYNDLAGHVTRFREGVRTAVAQRRQEASELEAEIGVGGMHLQERKELRSQKKKEQQESHHQKQARTSTVGVVGTTNVGIPDALPAPTPISARAGGNVHSPPTPAVIANAQVQTPIPGLNVPNGGGGSMAQQRPRNQAWTPDMGIKFG
ncbi:pH-response regulator protein palA/rim20 [Lithohypha guttulata]|uniref:PH-response regulator protein palA/rim20 n=1 Tax=Lithohypha guttulata TaxID=1690604 RepID=A0AAN7YJU0_9EURO|nr:pH-response regulator protein palA/rim20 [Lithohypha guttulata]